MSDQQIDQWHNEINNARCEHQHSLRQQLQRLKKSSNAKTDLSALDRFKKKLSSSISRVTKLKDIKLAIRD